MLGRSYPCPPLPGWCDWWDVAHHRELSSVALFPRFGLVPTSPIHGWTLVIAQGRVLSPLLFNLLVNSLAATISRASPGVRLSSCSDFRLSNQLYADDLVILQESTADLQAALDAVSHWGQQWRFSFGIGPEKSAVVIFGPPRHALTCEVYLQGDLLPVVSAYRYLGVVLTPTLSWCNHVDHLVDRGRRLFAQCVSWVRSEGLPVSFSLFLLSTYVLPSASFGIEFAGESRSLARFDRALRQWGRHLLGWPSGTPNASVLCELGLHDGLRVSSGRALALCARLASFALSSRPPVPASVFTLAQSTPGSWAHWCRAVISHHSVQRPDLCGVGPGCSASVTQRWVRRSVTPVLDRSWRQRVERSLGLLHTIRCDPRAQPQLSLPAFVYSQSVDAGLARWWGLARYGHDPGPRGRAARHRNSSPVCSFCCADVGDLAHCLSYCPAFSDLRAQWCVDSGVAPSDGPWWASGEWVFDPWHVDNTPSVMRAHVRFVGLICSRLERSLPSC